MTDLFGKLETEVEINAPASKFYEMFHIRPYLIPKVSPDKIQSCELHEGEWGKVGSVLHWNYFHDGKAWDAKELVEAIDEKNNLIAFKLVGGCKFEDYYKSFKSTIQSIPKDKGSVIHWTFEYEKLHEKNVDNLHYNLMKFCVAVSKDLDVHLMEMEGKKESLVDVVAAQT